MPHAFAELSAELESLIRARVAKECRFPEAAQPSKFLLRGTPVTFYRNVWLAYLEPIKSYGAKERRYFLTRPKARKDRVVPLKNEAGSVDRANRRYTLTLTKENFVDYLNFYYLFTPQEDPILSRLPGGPTQFKVPRDVRDVQFAPTEEPDATHPECSDECLAFGAIWHFLDEEVHDRVVPFRFKRKNVAPFTVSGRLPIQFRQALFATDFRVPQTTGVPVLSTPELLYQSDSLVPPEVIDGPSLALPRRLKAKEWWKLFAVQLTILGRKTGERTLQALWWLSAVLFLYFWGCAALFSLLEWTGQPYVRDNFEWWNRLVGGSSWTMTGLVWTAAAIFTFAWLIILTTHRDKAFNWVFRLCPSRLQPWLVGVLDYFVTRWDNALVAQHTLSKRLWWSAAHLVAWTTYMVFAFASLQLLVALAFKQPSGTALVVAHTLLLQAILNIPFVTFVLIQFFGLAEWLDPVAEGIVNYWVLAVFQGVMAMVVFRGLYRVWVFTVEASPYTFFRRLRHNPGSRRRRASAT